MVRGEHAGTATNLADVRDFLRRTRLDDLGEIDLHTPELVEWRGGGPEIWE